MRTFLRSIVALGMTLGLLVGQVAPAYANSEKGKAPRAGLSLSSETFVTLSTGEQKKYEMESLREQRKKDREERQQESEDDQTGSGSQVGSSSGSVIEGHDKSQASFGRLVSGTRREFNTFWHNIQRLLQEKRAQIAALSVSARIALYTQIQSLIHTALLDLQVKISAAITTAVGS